MANQIRFELHVEGKEGQLHHLKAILEEAGNFRFPRVSFAEITIKEGKLVAIGEGAWNFDEIFGKPPKDEDKNWELGCKKDLPGTLPISLPKFCSAYGLRAEVLTADVGNLWVAFNVVNAEGQIETEEVISLYETEGDFENEDERFVESIDSITYLFTKTENSVEKFLGIE